MINFKKINKKYLYIGSAIIMVFWISFLSSRTKIPTSIQDNTLPITPSQTQKQPQDIKVSDIIPVANTTPFGLGNYSIKNKKLIFTLPEGNGYQVDTQEKPVTNFDVNNSTIIITTGELYATSSSYFVHDINANKTYPLDTGKVEPVVSVSSFDSKSIAILGSFSPKNYKTSLYFYNPILNQKSLILTNLSRNFVRNINNNFIVLGKSIDKAEPNFVFDIYDTNSNSYITKDLLSSQKTFCSNSTNFFYLDYKDKLIKKTILTSQKTENTNIKIETESTQFLCNDSSLFLVSSNKNEIKIKSIKLDTLSITEKDKTLKDKQILIQSYLQKDNLLFKVYDYTNKSFSFIPGSE